MSEQLLKSKSKILETLPKTEETAVIVTINFVCGMGEMFPEDCLSPNCNCYEKPKKTKSK